jgi:hypothetical protein
MSSSRRIGVASLFALAIACLGAASAGADVSEAVQKKLKGKLFVASEPFVLDGDDDKEVVKNLQKHARAELKHDKSQGIATWHLAFVAFLSKKPGVSEVSVDFYTDDGKATYAANKRLAGVSPSIPLLASEFQITEDDGLTPGASYVVKLTARVKGKDVVLASTKLKMR